MWAATTSAAVSACSWPAGGGRLAAAVGLPASLQVRDRLWVYTHPSVGIRMSGVGRIPVGVGLPLGSRLRLDLEGGVAYPYTSDFALDAAFRQGPRGWFGVGLNTIVGK